MPREDRQARTARIARQFGQWLDQTMTDQNIRNFELVERAAAFGGTFKVGHVGHWRKGHNTANPENVITLARALNQNPLVALRMAGHDEIAAILEQYGAKLAAPGERATSARRVQGNQAHPAIAEAVAMIRGSGLPAADQDALRGEFEAELDSDIQSLQAIVQRRIDRLVAKNLRLQEAAEVLSHEDDEETRRLA